MTDQPPVQAASAAAQASEVWDILVRECGAAEGGREDYCRKVAASGWPQEWRFCGALGFGGKVRHDPHGDRLYVDCYREDETPERRAAMAAANDALLRAQPCAADVTLRDADHNLAVCDKPTGTGCKG